MSFQSIDIDNYINTIQSAVHDEKNVVDNSALVNHALEEARECTRKMDSPMPQIGIGYNEVRIDENSHMPSTNITLTTLIENTEALPKNPILESVTIYQCNLCFESTTSYSYFRIHLQVVHNKDQDCDMTKHPELPPSLDKFNTYCHPCELECVSVMYYQQHIQSVHHISSQYDQIKGLGTGSSPIDLNYYCEVCKVYFMASWEHQNHLQSQHHLNQLSAADPINYCSTCNITYLTQELYQRHLYYRHQVHEHGADPNKMPTITLPFNYCYYCDKQYKNNAKYVRHLKHYHRKMLLQHKRLPKLSDLGYACLICQTKFPSQTQLQGHLKDSHVIKDGEVKIEEVDESFGSADLNQQGSRAIVDVTPTDPYAETIPNLNRISPDINAHEYCRSCQTTFLSNWNYRIHLRLVHYLYVEENSKDEAKDTSDDTLLPDPHNRDWYCCVCKKHKKSSRSYRKHCKRVHHMKFKHKKVRQA